MNLLPMTIIQGAVEVVALPGLVGASPLEVLNAMALSNLLGVHLWSRRLADAHSPESLFVLWATSIGSMLCWIIGIAALASLDLL